MFSLPKWGRHRQQQEMQNIHSASETEQILQKDRMFAYIHSMQEKGWHLVKAMIATYTNSFLKQQEHKGIISLSDKITVISLLH